MFFALSEVVMDGKITTRAWNPNPQISGGGNQESRNEARAQAQALGANDLGEYLNKIADPNWVDPNKNRKVGNSQLDKDAFMKLMLAQMKNQDPTNSQKSHEMAAQLAQFTSLEQLFNVNDNLKNMQTQQEPVGQFQALNLIGKSVSGDTSRLVRVAGDKKHDFSFDLNGDAKDVKISVANETGQEIRSFSLSDLKKGTNRISWNGLDSQDNPTPSGNYRVSVEARDDRGKAVNAVTEFGGQITGVTFGKEGPILMIGDQKIRFSDVKTIVDSTLLKDKSEVKTLNLDSTESPQVKENKINTVASSPVLQGVGLSQGMMKKLIETKE
jgi:flagellar basal-body rod modification protein FlgD